MNKTTELKNIELCKINPSLRNPRKTISKDELAELATNIKSQGLLQPITVRPVSYDVINKDGCVSEIEYEIVCGERRYRAVRMNANGDKTATIACIVKEMTDEEAFEAMITENLQRKDVDPMEEAFAFCELVKAGKTVDEIADRFGKPKRFVQERIKLNSLIDALKAFTTKGVIPIAGAMLLSKVKEEMQTKFFDYLQERYERDEELVLEVREIRQWIEREFMTLDNCKFLEWDEDDETAPPTEDWNKGQFEKCATCCMNTGNAGCLFYSMKNKFQYCMDRECYEKKMAAYLISEVERIGEGCIVKEGEKAEPGRVLILDNDPSVTSGYDSVKKTRQRLMKMLRDKGYMVAPFDAVGARCKYYGDDKRIPKLLKQGKVVKCITLGTPYYIGVEEEYFYFQGAGEEKEVVPPELSEARALSDKFRQEEKRMNDKLDSTLLEMSREKDYADKKGRITETEECMFWSLILSECSTELSKELFGTVLASADTIIGYVKRNLTNENKLKWYRDHIIETCRRKSYGDIGNQVMRMLFMEEYNEEYSKLAEELGNKLKKRTAKTKARLDELGYNIKGEKIKS